MTKILILGLEGALPDQLLGQDRLANLRRLMALGCYGPLQGSASVTEREVWLALATGCSPDMLGPTADLSTIWDQIAAGGGRSIVVGGPIPRSPGAAGDICVACQLPADESVYTVPEPIREVVSELGGYPVRQSEASVDEIVSDVRQRFRIVTHLMEYYPWECLCVVEQGLALLRDASSADSDAMLAPLVCVDEEIGDLLELLTDDTVLLVVSPPLKAVAGSYILVATNSPLEGELSVRLQDLAPTLLGLAGHRIPDTMHGTSQVGERQQTATESDEEEEERILRERLSGLGYIG